MSTLKKVTKAGILILGALIMSILLASTYVIISKAADSSEPPGSTEEVGAVMVLEATVVEGFDWSQGISPYTMLTDCMISVSGDSEGMHIGIATGVVGIGSVLGVKDVKIYKKGWFGIWDLVATSSGGESYDRSTMGISILYPEAVKDATYKITCIHYGNVNGYTEYENDSGAFVYSFYSD